MTPPRRSPSPTFARAATPSPRPEKHTGATTAPTDLSHLFFRTGRILAPSSQSHQANGSQPITPIVAQTPKNNTPNISTTNSRMLPASEHRTSVRTHPAEQSHRQVPVVSSNSAGKPGHTPLNPLAHAFVPFSVLLPSLDSNGKTSSDHDSCLGSEEFDDKADDIYNNDRPGERLLKRGGENFSTQF